MTSTENSIAPRPAPEPGFIGQGTAVEQARAVAEAQAAVMVAQRCPRSVPEAVRQMRESCDQYGLAETAFYRFSRGGGQVTGPSIQLARELARCWGNMRYGIAELRRDDVKGESEMHAFAEDLQTNTRATTTFIVKHIRDTKGGSKVLTDQRDIYESNANNGARRVREQIFAILPKWYTAEAEERCRETLKTGGGKPLATRIADMVKAFDGLGVSVDQLERKIGREQGKWNDHDAAALTVIGRSIKNGETSVADEFPDDKVTGAEILGEQPAKPRNGKATTKVEAAPINTDDDPCPVCAAMTGQPHDDDVHEAAGA